MRSEYTRQTRWGHLPEDSHGDPGAPNVKQVIWASCTECDLQVHATRTQCIAVGIACPECGKPLAPSASEGNGDGVGNILAEEQQFYRLLRMEEA